MRISSYKLLLATIPVLAATPALAAEHNIECPAQLPQDALQVVHPPSGWTAFVPTALRLSSVAMMNGPPSKMAILKPDEIKQQKNKKQVSWQDLNDGPAPGGKWIACNYGAGNNDVILSRKIDDKTSQCTVTYTGTQPGERDIAIVCSW
ncbi:MULTISPECIES: STY0301 family protein [unclassified Duganella]|uniref:STY0301 family protein n=1 Tax=unclassified Duganella TaxID=2636909 RepID=UPI0011C159C8|nr:MULTISPECIES: STY0301 family protein [unclassified Duganella]